MGEPRTYRLGDMISHEEGTETEHKQKVHGDHHRIGCTPGEQKRLFALRYLKLPQIYRDERPSRCVSQNRRQRAARVPQVPRDSLGGTTGVRCLLQIHAPALLHRYSFCTAHKRREKRLLDHIITLVPDWVRMYVCVVQRDSGTTKNSEQR